jgi:hypothetical protein
MNGSKRGRPCSSTPPSLPVCSCGAVERGTAGRRILTRAPERPRGWQVSSGRRAGLGPLDAVSDDPARPAPARVPRIHRRATCGRTPRPGTVRQLQSDRPPSVPISSTGDQRSLAVRGTPHTPHTAAATTRRGNRSPLAGDSPSPIRSQAPDSPPGRPPFDLPGRYQRGQRDPRRILGQNDPEFACP